jgi:hypothetical protein
VRAKQLPIVTSAAVGVALVAAVVQYTVPAAIPALQRTPGGLAAGQWWRLVTPLFVQTLGWYQVVTNLVTLAAVGAVAEWHLGRGRWAALFAAGTIGGQAAAYLWGDPGGGDSIAICGLAGGLVIWWLTGRPMANRWALAAVVGYVAALTGWGFAGIRAAALAVVVAALVLWIVPGRRVVLLGAMACAVALLIWAADLHGASLVAGMIAAPPLIWLSGRASGRASPAGGAPR